MINKIVKLLIIGFSVQILLTRRNHMRKESLSNFEFSSLLSFCLPFHEMTWNFEAWEDCQFISKEC